MAIHFFSGKKEFRSPSNFWEREVVLDGHTYKSGEHAFHGEKYRLLSELCEPERKQQLFEYSQIFLKPSLYKTGAAVKRMGGKKGMPLSPEELSKWYILILEVQRNICRWKLELPFFDADTGLRFFEDGLLDADLLGICIIYYIFLIY